MRNKFLGIVIFMLLISSTTTLALTPFSKNIRQMKNQLFDTTPVPSPTSKGWMKTFGGTGMDYGWSVQQTTDGGYIIGAETYSFGVNGDILVIKTDGNGNKVWEKSFGGSSKDYQPDVKQTNDNGYIILGRTLSFGAGENDLWVIKIDENGTEQWNTTFGKQYYDYSSEIQQTSDDGYIIVGSVNLYEPLLFDVWLIKIDGEGKEQWNRTFGEPQQEDFGCSVHQTSDGGYIVAGDTMSYGHNKGYAVWLIKTDAQGIEQWNRTYGGTDAWGGAISVDLTSDDGYIILSNREQYEPKQVDVWVIKTGQYGDEQWNKTYGGTQKDDYGCVMYETSDQGYVIIGTIADLEGTDSDAWMEKIDFTGDEQWSKTYGGKEWDTAYSGHQTSDGGYIITGSTQSFAKNDKSDVWLIKTDSQGKSTTMSLGNLWFERLFQWFPNAFQLLRQLLE